MLIETGDEIYEVMVVGFTNKPGDLAVNVVKAKAQSNVRSSGKDNTVVIKKPVILSLEESIQFLEEDELCEVTPESIRIRKKLLNAGDRARYERDKKYKEQNK